MLEKGTTAERALITVMPGAAVYPDDQRKGRVARGRIIEVERIGRSRTILEIMERRGFLILPNLPNDAKHHEQDNKTSE
jgi:hypothetical protein